MLIAETSTLFIIWCIFLWKVHQKYFFVHKLNIKVNIEKINVDIEEMRTSISYELTVIHFKLFLPNNLHLWLQKSFIIATDGLWREYFGINIIRFLGLLSICGSTHFFWFLVLPHIIFVFLLYSRTTYSNPPMIASYQRVILYFNIMQYFNYIYTQLKSRLLLKKLN